LVDRSEFDAYSAFRRITTEHYGGVTLFELRDFFAHHDIAVESYELDLLYAHLDNNHDGVIAWKEFLNIVMSKEYHSGCQHGKLADFSLELEHSLIRVFDQELQNEVVLEQSRRALWDTPHMSEKGLWEMLDVDKNGSITPEDFHQFLAPYVGDSYTTAQSQRIWNRMDNNKNADVDYEEFLRSIRPIYCYKQYDKTVPAPRDISPTRVYHKPGKKVEQGSQSNLYASVNMNMSQSASTKVLKTTEYDAQTGRPVGKKVTLLTEESPDANRRNAQSVGLDLNAVGLNPEHPTNRPDVTAERWDRVMSWNGEVDPLKMMALGMHPLDVATGQQYSRYFTGEFHHPMGSETVEKTKSHPLNPENPESPLKARVSVPTVDDLYNTRAGGAKGKSAKDHPFYVHQRLIERTLGDEEYLANPNMPKEEREKMVQTMKEEGLSAWQHGDPTMFAKISANYNLPWADPKMDPNQKREIMRNQWMYGQFAGMSEEDWEKAVKEGKFPGLGA
jgi:Ca2+-binding EF-hand superfamily protein